MSSAAPPSIQLMPDQLRAMPAHLVPLWTWLAALTLAVSVYFLGASQGWPLLPSFGLSKNASAEEVRGSVAALLGVPTIAILLLLFTGLTVEWMRRSRSLDPAAGRWKRLPAPDLWGLPITDHVTRTMRLVVWLLVLGMPVYSMVHLMRLYPRADFYQQCVEELPKFATCVAYPEKKKPGEPEDPNPLMARVFDARGNWFQRMGVHLSLGTPEKNWIFLQSDYFRHGFRYGDAHGPSYYPGLQAWAYLLLVGAALASWLAVVVRVIR